MFDAKHYVPILKWKPAEMRALLELTSAQKAIVTPYLQIVMPNPKAPKRGEQPKTEAEQLEDSKSKLQETRKLIPQQILNHWGTSAAFVDVSLVDSNMRSATLSEILTIGATAGTNIIPAIGLNTDVGVQNVAVNYAQNKASGICLRLSHLDCNNTTTLISRLRGFLDSNSFKANDVDLLVDYQDNPCPDLRNLLNLFPFLHDWRTLTFASGAFPVDLSPYSVGEHYIDRSDWQGWQRQYDSNRLPRAIAFGDYTIQHPIYKEAARFFLSSASLRYTLPEKWLILRGQKGKNQQYLAHAQLLSQAEEYEDVFFGQDFCFGDKFITEKGKDLNGKPGNATQWLVAGINHHLACTVSQIASLT